MQVKLDDVIESLDFTSIDMNYYYNPKTEEIIMRADFLDDIDEDLLEECIPLPSQYDINEYDMMVDFADEIEDVKIHNQLYISLNGSGAFRRFKDTCINFEIIDDWYKYREKRLKEIAVEWCNENNIKYH